MEKYPKVVQCDKRGQIVIPKKARDIFNIKSGDTLLILGDERKGIAIVKADLIKHFATKILASIGRD